MVPCWGQGRQNTRNVNYENVHPNLVLVLLFVHPKVEYLGLLIIRGKKSEISRDLKRQIRGENGRFRRIFVGFSPEFRGKFSLKSKQESKKERFLTKILEGCQIQGKKETQNFIQHSSEGNCTCFEQQEKHIKLYRNAWPVNLLFQLQFSAENKFRCKTKWKGIFRKLCFENSGQPLEVVLFSENLEIPELFCSIWHSIIKLICPTARVSSWLAILHKNATICFLGAMNGRPCGFPTGMRPVWITPWQRTREKFARFPSHLKMTFKLIRQIPWNSGLKMIVYTG